MTKLVLVSDIHANFLSLKAVVDEEGFDAEYTVLGDIHGLNGYPQETQTMVQTLDGVTLAGNHDKAIFQYHEGHVNSKELSQYELDHTLDSLSDEQHEWMLDLPYMEVEQRGDARICYTHAWPYPERASGYERGNAGVRKRDVIEVASAVADDYDYVFHGHTHEQYDLDCSKWGQDVHFVNPGSVGYAATYSTVDTDSGEVEHKSVEYDHEELKQHVQSLLPDDAPHVENWL